MTRRECFAALAGMGFGSRGYSAEPHEKYPRNLTKADTDCWMTELSNWGRWRKDDQAGTINLITPAKRKQAASLVKDGVSVSMSLDADIPGQSIPRPNAAPAQTGAPGRPRYTWEPQCAQTAWVEPKAT